MRTAKYCSQTCQYVVIHPPATRVRRPPLSTRVKTARRKSARAARGVRGTRRWTSGQCRVCSTWFVSQHGDVTCGADCSQQHQLNRRNDKGHNYRARKVAAFVEKVYRKRVFDADGYRCHLCGQLTDRTKKVPHPRAPTIDHVIPLAVGGKHEPGNCRTACFLCNCTKRDVVAAAQQLALTA